MTNSTNVTIRVDKNVKEQADKLFKDLGLNTNSAINIFLRKCVNEGGIPFKISLNNSPQKQLVAIFVKEPDISDLPDLTKHNTL